MASNADMVPLSEQFMYFRNHFAEFKASLSERVEEVESRERNLGEYEETLMNIKKDIEMRERKFNQDCRLWEETRKVIMMVVRERVKGLLRFREMEEELKELKMELLREKMVYDQLIEESKLVGNVSEKEEIERRRKELELKEKSVHEKLELVQKDLDYGFRDVESREKRVNEDRKRVELSKREVCEREQALELEKKRVEKTFDALEFMMDQIQEICVVISTRKAQAKKLGEQQMDEGVALLEKEKAKRVDELHIKEMELREKELDEQRRILESKEKDLNERSRVLESKEKEMNRLLESRERDLNEQSRLLESKEMDLNEQSRLLESKEKRLRVETRYQETKFEIYRLCQAMDGKSLQRLLNERVSEHESLRGVLSKALQMWIGAPKLVLTAVCRFFPPFFDRPKLDSREYEASEVRSSCILLLELLLKAKLPVTEGVKNTAVEVAKQWDQNMKAEGETDVVVLGFLLFVAAYKLGSNFDRSDLERLYKIVAQHRLAPVLWFRLGLSKSKFVSTSLPQVKSGKPQSDTSLLANAEVASPLSQAKSGKPKPATPRVTSTVVPPTVEGTKNPAKLSTVKSRGVSDSPPDLVSDVQWSSKCRKKRSASLTTSSKREKRPRIEANKLSATPQVTSTGASSTVEVTLNPAKFLTIKNGELSDSRSPPSSDAQVSSKDGIKRIASSINVKHASVPQHSTGLMLRPTAPAGSVLPAPRPHQSSDPQDVKNQVNQPTAGSNRAPTDPHCFPGPMLRPPVPPINPHGSLSDSQYRSMQNAAAVLTPNQGTWPVDGGVYHHIQSRPPIPSAAPSHPASSISPVWPIGSLPQTRQFGGSGACNVRNPNLYDYYANVWR